MGSHTFETTIYGYDHTPDGMENAYRHAVEDALYEDGHDGYNGTISTTEGVRRSSAHPDPVGEAQVDWDQISKLQDRLSKWDVCEAVPVYKSIPAKVETLGSIIMQVTVPSDTPESEWHDTLTAACEKQIAKFRREGLSVGTVDEFDPTKRESKRVVFGKKDQHQVRISRFQIVTPPKITTAATKGATETRFFIITPDQRMMPEWDKGYATQAKARAALPTTPRWNDTEFEIISMTRRVGGQALVTHSIDTRGGRKNTPVQCLVRVSKVVTPATVDKTRTGWLFYGWAAS